MRKPGAARDRAARTGESETLHPAGCRVTLTVAQWEKGLAKRPGPAMDETGNVQFSIPSAPSGLGTGLARPYGNVRFASSRGIGKVIKETDPK